MSSAIDSLLLFRSEKTEASAAIQVRPSGRPALSMTVAADANAPTASENPEAPQAVWQPFTTHVARSRHGLFDSEDDLHVLEKAVMSLDSRLLRRGGTAPVDGNACHRQVSAATLRREPASRRLA